MDILSWKKSFFNPSFYHCTENTMGILYLNFESTPKCQK